MGRSLRRAPTVSELAAAWDAQQIPMLEGIPVVAGLRRTAIAHDDGRLLLERYHVIDSRSVSIRFHHWLSSDDDRAPHDHPWSSMTVALTDGLLEHAAGTTAELEQGTVITRAAVTPHRIELTAPDAWTLFVTGPVVRRWGFHTAGGWVHWHDWPGAGRYV
jgi:hypothetical protein